MSAQHVSGRVAQLVERVISIPPLPPILVNGEDDGMSSVFDKVFGSIPNSSTQQQLSAVSFFHVACQREDGWMISG